MHIEGWVKLDQAGFVFGDVKKQFETTWDADADKGVNGYKVARPIWRILWEFFNYFSSRGALLLEGMIILLTNLILNSRSLIVGLRPPGLRSLLAPSATGPTSFNPIRGRSDQGQD